MADNYVPVYFDWLEVTSELNDQEKGRLIDAIVLFARGEDPANRIKGNERYLFPSFQRAIERSAVVRSKRAASGAKGGAAKTEAAKQTEASCSKSKQSEASCSKSKQSEANCSKPKQTVANPTYNNNDDDDNNNEDKKENEEEYDSTEDRTKQVIPNRDDDISRDSARRDNGVVIDIGHAQRDTAEMYADTHLAHMTPHSFEEMRTYIDDFNQAGAPGEEFVRLAIDQACDNGSSTWAYVRTVLNSYLGKGFKTKADIQRWESKRREKSALRQRGRDAPDLPNDPLLRKGFTY